ncbi:hypothetical protein ACFX2A_024274 [Malus domestica]
MIYFRSRQAPLLQEKEQSGEENDLHAGDPVQNQKLRTPSPSTAKPPSPIVDLSSALLQPCFFIFSFWITPAPWPRLRRLPSTVDCENKAGVSAHNTHHVPLVGGGDKSTSLAAETLPAGGPESPKDEWACELQSIRSGGLEAVTGSGGGVEKCGLGLGGFGGLGDYALRNGSVSGPRPVSAKVDSRGRGRHVVWTQAAVAEREGQPPQQPH